MMWQFLLIALLASPPADTGESTCKQPPKMYKGAKLSDCTQGKDIECCSYSNSTCIYILCSSYCSDEYTEATKGCH